MRKEKNEKKEGKNAGWRKKNSLFVFSGFFLVLFFVIPFANTQAAATWQWGTYSTMTGGSCTSSSTCPSGPCTPGSSSGGCGTCSSTTNQYLQGYMCSCVPDCSNAPNVCGGEHFDGGCPLADCVGTKLNCPSDNGGGGGGGGGGGASNVCTFNVRSTGVSGVPIQVGGTLYWAGGTTNYSFNYTSYTTTPTTASFYAPATADGQTFLGWSGCDSQNAENRSCDVRRCGNITVTANYSGGGGGGNNVASCGSENGRTIPSSGPDSSKLCVKNGSPYAASNFSARCSGGQWTGWIWNCDNVSCSATRDRNTGAADADQRHCSGDSSVSGSCGSANGKDFSSTPRTNLCASGTPSEVIYSTFSPGAGWSWSCGSARCSAREVLSSPGGSDGVPPGGSSGSTERVYCSYDSGSIMSELPPDSQLCSNGSPMSPPSYVPGSSMPSHALRPSGTNGYWEWRCGSATVDLPQGTLCFVWKRDGGSSDRVGRSTVSSQGGTIKVSGFCGSAAKNYSNADTQYSGSFCFTGIHDPINPTFPSIDGSSQWTCRGMTGGTDSSICTATRGAGLGSQSSSVASPASCSVYNSSSAAVLDGYGSPFNMLSSSREQTLSVSCSDGGAIATAGSQNTYTYKSGFVSVNGQWRGIDFSGAQDANNPGWFKGSALSNLPPPPSSGQNFVLAFVCQYHNSEWKCGCRDSACAQNYWTLQAYKK